MAYLSDSELGKTSRGDSDAFEETTVFSDSLYGDSLPSMRAQLAATQMQNRRRRNDNLENSVKESKSLLGSDNEDNTTSVTTVMETSLKKDTGSQGQYNSLGGQILPKKKTANKERLKQT